MSVETISSVDEAVTEELDPAQIISDKYPAYPDLSDVERMLLYFGSIHQRIRAHYLSEDTSYGGLIDQYEQEHAVLRKELGLSEDELELDAQVDLILLKNEAQGIMHWVVGPKSGV